MVPPFFWWRDGSPSMNDGEHHLLASTRSPCATVGRSQINPPRPSQALSELAVFDAVLYVGVRCID